MNFLERFSRSNVTEAACTTATLIRFVGVAEFALVVFARFIAEQVRKWIRSGAIHQTSAIERSAIRTGWLSHGFRGLRSGGTQLLRAGSVLRMPAE